MCFRNFIITRDINDFLQYLLWKNESTLSPSQIDLTQYNQIHCSCGIGVPEQKWDIVKTLEMSRLRVFYPPRLAPYQHYLTFSFIFPSPCEVFVTVIAAPIAKNTETYSYLPPPLVACIFVVHIRCLCHLRYRDHSSLAKAKSPPLPRHCQLLPSHFQRCQPLFAFSVTAPINGWLLHASLLHCLLPDPLSATPIIDTFIAGCHTTLFSICTVLFSIAPLPPSTVAIPPATAFNPHTQSCPSHYLVWLSLIHPGWLLRHILSRHLPPPPVVLPLPLAVRPDWLWRSHLCLSLRHRIPLACASISFYPMPPPSATGFIVLCCWGWLMRPIFVDFGGGQRLVFPPLPPPGEPQHAQCSSAITLSEWVEAWLWTLPFNRHIEGPDFWKTQLPPITMPLSPLPPLPPPPPPPLATASHHRCHCHTGRGKTTDNEEEVRWGWRRAEETLCQGGVNSSQKSCSPFCFLNYLQLIPLHPNLNHSVHEVKTKQFDMGTNNGSRTSHASADLGNVFGRGSDNNIDNNNDGNCNVARNGKGNRLPPPRCTRDTPWGYPMDNRGGGPPPAPLLPRQWLWRLPVPLG